MVTGSMGISAQHFSVRVQTVLNSWNLIDIFPERLGRCALPKGTWSVWLVSGLRVSTAHTVRGMEQWAAINEHQQEGRRFGAGEGRASLADGRGGIANAA